MEPLLMMCVHFLAGVLLLDLPAVKEVPPIPEPDWKAPESVDAAELEEATSAWRDLWGAHYGIDLEGTPPAEGASNRLYDSRFVFGATLVKNPDAAQAASTRILQTMKDDCERLSFALHLRMSDAVKIDEAAVAWALQRLEHVDDCGSLVEHAANLLVSQEPPKYLAAAFVVLKVQTGSLDVCRKGVFYGHELAVFALARSAEQIKPYLYSMLKARAPNVRGNTAFLLGYCLDEDAKPLLLEMLDPKDSAAAGAAFALGEIGATEATAKIAQLLTSRDEINRYCAARALGQLGPGALPHLRAALETESDNSLQREIEKSIATVEASLRPNRATPALLDRKQLDSALVEAAALIQIPPDIEQIAGSATRSDLPKLKALRMRALGDYELDGSPFWAWTEIVKRVMKKR